MKRRRTEHTRRRREARLPVLDALAARSFRVTRQRKHIIAQFAAARRFITPQELCRLVRKRNPRVALATIYRTIDMLRRIGAAAQEPHPKGESAYVFCPEVHHHHAVCTRCGRVDDVPCRSVTAFTRSLSASLNFRLTQHRLEFFGTCARCSKAA